MTRILILGLITSCCFGQINSPSDTAIKMLYSMEGKKCNMDYCVLKEAMQEYDLSAYKIILTGEAHQFKKANSRIFFSIQKYLYEEYGINNILFEGGYSFVKLLNNYIEHPNDRDWFLISHCNSVDTNIFQTHLDYIHEQNKSGKNKIRFIGIDYETSYSSAINNLAALLPPETIPPKEISNSVDFIRDYSKRIDNHDFRQVAKYRIYEIVNSFADQKEIYKIFLSDNFTEFDLVIKGLRLACENRFTMEKFIQKREAFLYNETKKAIAKYPNEKFYGQFGLVHVPTEQMENWFEKKNWSSFATRLTNDSIIETQIFTSILYYRRKSKMYNMLTETQKFFLNTVYSDNPIFYSIDSNYLKGMNSIIAIE